MSFIHYLPHADRSPFERDNAARLVHSRIYQLEHDGHLPDNRFWRRLEWRYELNPVQFEHWHPDITCWIKENEEACKGKPPTLPWPQPPECKPPDHGKPPHCAVPEPTSLRMLALALPVLAWLANKRKS